MWVARQATQTRVARRGHLLQRERAAASSLDPLMYPIGNRKTYPKWAKLICRLSVLSPTKSMVYICELTPVEVLGWAATLPHRHQLFPKLFPATHAQLSLHISSTAVTSIVETYHVGLPVELPKILQRQGQV